LITDDFNHARYRPGLTDGHYESYFQRANHPTKPQAFWIRYTVFSAAGNPAAAVGELWAIVFDQDRDLKVAARSEVPVRDCLFAADRFEVRIGEATLTDRAFAGRIGSPPQDIAWDMRYSGGDRPVFDLPLERYVGNFPRAKALVGAPMAAFHGAIALNGSPIEIDGWVGSQNHNWGSRHTDSYVWGQVCGFDNAPESFLEIAAARLRLGPVWSPTITLLTLRHREQEYSWNSIVRGLRTKSVYEPFRWRFAASDKRTRIEGEVLASESSFVSLTYRNPPGGQKICLNTKLASCKLQVTDIRAERTESLSTRHRAAFEIVADNR
jgi:hypothetical protein